jgi:hypothetical protein
MQYLLATKNIPYCYLDINFEANYDKSAILRPVYRGHLRFDLSFVFGLKLDVFGFRRSTVRRQHYVFLHKHEVIFEVGVVGLAELHELVNIVIRLSVIVIVQTETAEDLFRQEIHYQNVGILATNGDQGALRVE